MSTTKGPGLTGGAPDLLGEARPRLAAPEGREPKPIDLWRPSGPVDADGFPLPAGLDGTPIDLNTGRPRGYTDTSWMPVPSMEEHQALLGKPGVPQPLPEPSPEPLPALAPEPVEPGVAAESNANSASVLGWRVRPDSGYTGPGDVRFAEDLAVRQRHLGLMADGRVTGELLRFGSGALRAWLSTVLDTDYLADLAPGLASRAAAATVPLPPYVQDGFAAAFPEGGPAGRPHGPGVGPGPSELPGWDPRSRYYNPDQHPPNVATWQSGVDLDDETWLCLRCRHCHMMALPFPSKNVKPDGTTFKQREGFCYANPHAPVEIATVDPHAGPVSRRVYECTMFETRGNDDARHSRRLDGDAAATAHPTVLASIRGLASRRLRALADVLSRG